MPSSRSSLERVLSLSTRPVGDGKTRPLRSAISRARSRTATARPDSGTRCSSFAFMRAGGTVQVTAASSTSSHRAPRTSPERQAVSTRKLEGERRGPVGTRCAHPCQRFADLRVRERLLVLAAHAVLRQCGGDGVTRRVVLLAIALRDRPLHDGAESAAGRGGPFPVSWTKIGSRTSMTSAVVSCGPRVCCQSSARRSRAGWRATGRRTCRRPSSSRRGSR